ncbi:MAG: maturase [Gammaproteobacteria bacterium]|nr:MAG: maturase [Gammaproteobacteria bacterium]
MDNLYKIARGSRTLEAAWRKVRENGLSSKSEDTKNQIARFAEDQSANIRRIVDQLREKKFKFSPQTGIAKKRKGKKPRPLVLAPVENRIVQRAILDVLSKKVQPLKEVLETPTSIGGVPGRGTRHAIELVTGAIKKGARYYIRSDIEGFFTKIPRQVVVNLIARHVPDKDFIDLLSRAIETTLKNSEELQEHRDLFPIGDRGVAQGSPLSPMLGNILLHEFDRDLNGRGIICIRYIDDFILLGSKEANVKKAFEAAREMLAKFDMHAYAPWENSKKAQGGPTTSEIDFLGCTINGGLVSPSRDARNNLLFQLDSAIENGKRAMREAVSAPNVVLTTRRYSQILAHVDRILIGWSHAFSFCNGRQAFSATDADVDARLAKLRDFTEHLVKKHPNQWRRIMGVHRLIDTPQRKP